MGASGPFFIKIDVQGYESFVMKGAKETLRETPSVISEFWPWGLAAAGSNAKTYIDLMLGNGYRAFDIWGRILRLPRIGRFQLLGSHHRSISIDLLFKKDLPGFMNH